MHCNCSMYRKERAVALRGLGCQQLSAGFQSSYCVEDSFWKWKRLAEWQIFSSVQARDGKYPFLYCPRPWRRIIWFPFSFDCPVQKGKAVLFSTFLSRMQVTINHCICLDPMVIFVRVPVSTFISGIVGLALIQSNWFVCRCNAALTPVSVQCFL